MSVHDSDIATISFQPTSSAADHFYLGFEPRIYFEAPDDHEPIDRNEAAAAFATWSQSVLGVSIDPSQILPFLASNDADDEPNDDFVEETVKSVLSLIALPLPQGFPEFD